MKLFDRHAIRSEPQELPFINLDDLVCFPGAAVPLYLNNSAALQALDQAMAANRQLFICYRLKGHPGLAREDMNPIGVFARINQVMKLPNNSSRLLVEIGERAEIREIRSTEQGPRLSAQALALDNAVTNPVARLMRATSESFQRYAVLHKKVPKEVMAGLEAADAPHRLVDLIAANLPLPWDQRLRLLNAIDAVPRLEELLICIDAECELLQLKGDIGGRVKQRLEQSQKEHYINEQIRELHRELGREEDDASGVRDLEERLKATQVPAEVRARCQTELKRLGRLQPMTPEANIVRNWLELVVELPWGPVAADRISLVESEAILNADHYDLAEAKDRILDFLAVRRLKSDLKAPILCFSGPPGTGKTSLGRSLARALGRQFIRVSLGGVRDEAEIRGHRRTYVGALPGKIIQNLRKTGVANPVFLLDEIDKLANDQRGDPASALLEVLDPEQNNSFADHYLEVPYDLSRVLFVCTANNLAAIPHALRDRLEIIEIPGYTRYDKQKIASGFIIPKQLREHGLESADISFEAEAISTIIDDYTMEAGVRQLERAIAKVARKIARTRISEPLAAPAAGNGSMAELPVTDSPRAEASLAAATILPDGGIPNSAELPPGPQAIDPALSAQIAGLRLSVTPELVREFLKKPRIKSDIVQAGEQVGVANGMAWTEAGGTVMSVEVRLVPGKGETILTGSLGDVMKESGRIALSILRVMHRQLGLPPDFARDWDIHIHVPEGATPKDGPSAGITLCTALASAFTGKPVRSRVAMTGEVTLTGRVLPVGGIREKLLAAHRHGLFDIVLPAKNRQDSDELPEEIQAELTLHFVEHIDEVLAHMLA